MKPTYEHHLRLAFETMSENHTKTVRTAGKASNIVRELQAIDHKTHGRRLDKVQDLLAEIITDSSDRYNKAFKHLMLYTSNTANQEDL